MNQRVTWTILMGCLLVGPAQAQSGVPASAAASSAPTAQRVREKVTFAADFLFDPGSTVIKADAAKARFDELVDKVGAVNLEVIIAIGHTDSMESVNSGPLSTRRAEAVKAYFVRKGTKPNYVYTEGKGADQPVADNRTAEGRSKNRRVEVEVVGTRERQ